MNARLTAVLALIVFGLAVPGIGRHIAHMTRRSARPAVQPRPGRGGLMRRVCAVAIGAALALAPPAVAADTQMLLVHGYGDAEAGTDCNGST